MLIFKDMVFGNFVARVLFAPAVTVYGTIGFVELGRFEGAFDVALVKFTDAGFNSLVDVLVGALVDAPFDTKV